MSVLPLVLLVVAAVCGYRAVAAIRAARLGHDRWSQGLAATPVGVAEIAAMAAAASASLGPGTFRQVVAVTGTADGRTRPAPLSGEPCVWSRLRTVRLVPDGRGVRSEVVVDRQVHSALRLREGDAEVAVDLLDATVDVPEAAGRDDGPDATDDVELGPIRITDRTLGFRHTEFRIDPGLRVTVIGEIRDTAAGLRITPAPDRPVTLTVDERGAHLDDRRGDSRAAVRRFVGYSAAAVVALLAAVASMIL